MLTRSWAMLLNATLAATLLGLLGPGSATGPVQETLLIGQAEWTRRDDGREKTWEQAQSYCEGLALAGHSDWKLPTIDQLRTIHDATNAAGTWHGGLFDSVYPVRMRPGFEPNLIWYWSATRSGDQRAMIFDFFTGRSGAFHTSFQNGAGAVCVRGPAS